MLMSFLRTLCIVILPAMNFDEINTEPKLMVSESLQDSFTADEVSQYHDMFITTALQIDEELITGNLVGVEFGVNPKLDIKIPLATAFEFIGNTLLTTNLTVRAIVMMLGEKTLSIPGPYRIFNAKIIEIEPENRLCVFAIDLIKDTERVHK